MSDAAKQPNEGQVPAPRKLAGRYDTQEALEKGYLEQFRETQRIIAEKNAMAEQLRTYQNLIDKAAATVTGDEDQDGGMSDAYIERVAAAKAAEILESTLNPLLKASEAAAGFEDQTAATRFLRENPEIQETFNKFVSVDPQGAARYVEREMETAHFRSAHASADAGQREVTEKTEAARRDAGVPKSGSMSREAPAAETDRDSERLKSLAKEARSPEGGVVAQRAYLAERLKGIRMWVPGEETPRVI